MKKNMRLSTKLMLSFAAVGVITLFLGLAGYYGAVKSYEAIEEIGIVRLPSVESLLRIKVAANSIKSAQRTLLDLGLSKELRQRQYENVLRNRKDYQDAWKRYEPLPQTPEEAILWKDFVPAWEKWREENNRFLEMSRKIEALDIGDPQALERDLERFRADHYRLVTMTLSLLKDGKSFEGGESHTDCRFGKWLSTFKSTNGQVQQIMKEVSEPHARFHETVARIKAAVAAGNKEEAEKLYASQMVPVMEGLFGNLRKLYSIAEDASKTAHEMEHQALTVAREAQIKANELLDKIIALNSDVALQAVKAEERNANMMKAFSLTAMIVGVALALLLGFFITRSITRPINRIIEGLNSGADQVSSASAQVSAASQSLAEGASEQASAIEETSSSLEEMASMTKQNAENANQAKTRMAEAREIVSRVNDHMNDMGEAIREITKSSEETGKIIKTIDEIAFQTNLLALNAAVEAARAGEAGAGFAVVADEVRNLAMRAAEAAKNTSDLIEKTIKAVKTGSDLTEATQQAFRANVEIAGKVGELVDEIAAASAEQSQGIEQINKAVTEMDKVTQQNAANAEESASASEEMNAQADEMKAMVQELVALVGGASNGGHAATRSLARGVSHRSVEAPVRRKALPATRAQVAAVARREVRPDQVIPLEDDELKGF